MSKFSTEQENFWAGEFGDEYIHRNNSDKLLASNLDFFSKALEEFKDINKVGLSLKIDDLPECYINKDKVQRWEGQFWRYKRSEQFFQAQLDTTFALYRVGTGHDLNNSLRAAPPYSARHLPWYSNSAEPTEEEKYYFAHASGSIATWTNEPVKQDHII